MARIFCKRLASMLAVNVLSELSAGSHDGSNNLHPVRMSRDILQVMLKDAQRPLLLYFFKSAELISNHHHAITSCGAKLALQANAILAGKHQYVINQKRSHAPGHDPARHQQQLDR